MHGLLLPPLCVKFVDYIDSDQFSIHVIKQAYRMFIYDLQCVAGVFLDHAPLHFDTTAQKGDSTLIYFMHSML